MLHPTEYLDGLFVYPMIHSSTTPLADRLRPKHYEALIGQKHLLGPQHPLMQALKEGKPHSMILWGPPGTGKTTIAQLFAQDPRIAFESLSAVNSGLKDIRAIIDDALLRRKEQTQNTVLFIDEIHRFNKAQQDIFLPFVEDGTLVLIGATTENPSFEMNRALLSRCRVYILKSLEEADLLRIVERALSHFEEDLNPLKIRFDLELRKKFIETIGGDARQMLNIIEIILPIASIENNYLMIDETLLNQALSQSLSSFDKSGDLFYEQISALHKSIRGSNPDAALYWFARMLGGGADPLYIARRLVRMASEDIGNADPKALELALQAWEVQKRLGSPEGELSLAQAIVYLAVAPKSNAVYRAFQKAQKDALQWPSEVVPVHLRNASTSFMNAIGYGKDYRYDHNEPYAFAAGQSYFPESMGEKIYYEPVSRGLEIKIAEKLAFLKALGLEKKPS